jgi:hypothetical protein
MKNQNGFSMVLLLILLTAIGGYVSATMSTGSRLSISLASVILMNATLGQSRQALISYSAHYAYLYGPKGAGVGHLPCPNTDSVLNDMTGWSVDHGPNPPCGGSAVAVGHLPSHISFPEGRYMIHEGLGPRVDYAVSDHVVNNPGNHPVNPALMSILLMDLKQLAILQQRALTANPNRIRTIEVMLSKKALMLAVRPSVAAWIIEKIDNTGGSYCVLYRKKISLHELHELDDRCGQINQLVQQCRSDSDVFQSNLLLLSLADVIPKQFQCAKSALEQIYIDGVPAKQHWLIRNGWLDWVSVEHDAQCAQLPSKPCRPIHSNLGTLEIPLEPLILRWVTE